MKNPFEHTSVLLQESIDGLNIKSSGTYVDATLGAGGHSALILSKLNQNGRLISFDQDITSIEFNSNRFANEIANSRIKIIHDNFANIAKRLSELEIRHVDGILYDLGVSSKQFDDASRGFSYRFDAKLDMRMDQSQDLTAWQIVNSWDFNDLVRIFSRYGEAKFAKQIARSIEKRRELKNIDTTFELVEVIKQSLPAKELSKKGHPAKKIFQALRIAVNDELGALENSLKQALKLISKDGGRISVISFQSLEDRIIKQIFNQASTIQQDTSIKLPIINRQEAGYRLINKKPILPSDKETSENNRAHSAKLRIIERV